jgi:putative effector of murein hydrolase
MLGPWLLTRTRVVHPLGRGLAQGTISHGQGTAQALAEGSIQGAIAGIAMGLGAIATAFVLPLAFGAR